MPAERKPIVVVGSINIDLVANTERIPVEGETTTGQDFHIYPGGKGANQAVAGAKLGYPVRMIGRLGDDAFAHQLRAGLENAGVDAAGVLTSPGTSGVAVILVARTGQNSIVVTPGANALVTPADLDASVAVIRSAGIVLTQLEIPIATVLHLAKICAREAVPLMLDPDPAQALPAELLSQLSWFTPNQTEAAFFLGESDDDPPASARLLKSRGIKGVVLKLGSRGAYLSPADGHAEFVKPFAVKAIDTTAAGDCFNGAFATGLCLGKNPVESARFAAAAAAISVTRAGAQPSMPTMHEVERMLNSTQTA
jgi:ribokinase